jgi:hypothetical protein
MNTKDYPVSKNFKLCEFLPLELFDNHTLEELLKMVDPRMFKIAQALRDMFGSMSINDRFKGGQFNQCGLRTKDSKFFNPRSAHSKDGICRALDMHRLSVPHDSVAMVKEIQKVYDKVFKPLGATEVENPCWTKGWLHISCRGNQGSTLRIVNP